MKRQNLLKNIFVFVRFVCIVMMLAGLAGIISAVAERSNSLSELTLLEERSSRANELERYLKKDENKYERNSLTLERKEDLYEKRMSRHKAELASYSATSGGIEMGEKQITDGYYRTDMAYEKFDAARDFFEDLGEALYTLKLITDDASAAASGAAEAVSRNTEEIRAALITTASSDEIMNADELRAAFASIEGMDEELKARIGAYLETVADEDIESAREALLSYAQSMTDEEAAYATYTAAYYAAAASDPRLPNAITAAEKAAEERGALDGLQTMAEEMGMSGYGDLSGMSSVPDVEDIISMTPAEQRELIASGVSGVSYALSEMSKVQDLFTEAYTKLYLAKTELESKKEELTLKQEKLEEEKNGLEKLGKDIEELRSFTDDYESKNSEYNTLLLRLRGNSKVRERFEESGDVLTASVEIVSEMQEKIPKSFAYKTSGFGSLTVSGAIIYIITGKRRKKDPANAVPA